MAKILLRLEISIVLSVHGKIKYIFIIRYHSGIKEYTELFTLKKG